MNKDLDLTRVLTLTKYSDLINKYNCSFSKSVSFKIMALEGLLTLLWFSLSESCEQFFDPLLVEVKV